MITKIIVNGKIKVLKDCPLRGICKSPCEKRILNKDCPYMKEACEGHFSQLL